MHEPDIRAGSNTSTRGFESHQNALQNYINIMNQGAQNQMNLIANIQHRNHERDQAKKRMEFESSENQKTRAHQTSEREAEQIFKHKEARIAHNEAKDRAAQQSELNKSEDRNRTQLDIDKWMAQARAMGVEVELDSKGKPVIKNSGSLSTMQFSSKYGLGEKVANSMAQNAAQNPQGTTIAEQTTLNPTPTGALTPTNPNEQNKDPKNLLPTQRT